MVGSKYFNIMKTNYDQTKKSANVMANIKNILGLIFLILGIITIGLFLFLVPNGSKIFGYIAWIGSIQYTLPLLLPVGIILIILGLCLYSRKS